MSLTIDASVFVSAVKPQEQHHTVSQTFLNRVGQAAIALVGPTLVLTETVAAIARSTGDAQLVQQASTLPARYPFLNLIELSETRAQQAAQLAAAHRLRGADAVYLAVAVEFGTTLITWDAEMLQRGANVVTVQTPTDWLAAKPSPSP